MIMYSIRTIYSFDAWHALVYPDGTAERPHEHCWRVEVELSSPKLDDAGCVVDFVALDNGMREILTTYEGKQLNELPQFIGRSTSTEVIAEQLFREVEKLLGESDASVYRVFVWEDDRHRGSYGRRL